ncbi:hypothetical protein [Sporosarcina sp. P33]|uniref:hypothetical protein n=1 Tax=Sporosarcina sp. P33 TaxID=1930764 RepID=UPI0009BC92FE|nr:hypothetical protein [Sporosarcina sp. P33]ARD47588.1 hypothetical protein SporoP33_04610 [Sporosarcina sp. P33]
MTVITMKVWVIALIESASGPVKPVFYYNPYDDTWTRDSKLGCSFSSEKEAYEKLEELGVIADVVEGEARLG